jgi:hypothetical protein
MNFISYIQYVASTSVADPGCFIPDPGPKIFLSQIRIRTFFILDRGSRTLHKKRDTK